MYPNNRQFNRFNDRRFNNQPQDKVDRITAKEVRLMDENRQLIGIMPTGDAYQTAKDRGLDLLPLNPNSEPAIAMLGDMNKFLYDKKKQAKEQEKKNRAAARASEEKEIMFPSDTSDSSRADRERLLDKGNEFLGDGHPVTFTIFFRGRKMAHADEALERIKEEMVAKITNGQMGNCSQNDKRFSIKFTPVKGTKNG